jgi:Ni,Fe-hydrogenase maturation factor
MTLQCEVSAERTLVVQLPDSVQPGTHDVVVIVDAVAAKLAQGGEPGSLMRFAGSIPHLAGVDGLAAQRQWRGEW